ncbi:estradiol 17-beta-dehydrogenase, putative [Entamoeba invadens IP1]|uniref:Estradiol 17-beta-dehydrogenase, putative n=1 Tax=Entamoeba invadens IP1 TaxID=370355 RepID=A0A0A1U6Q8_ENTIV|nr:estradiol 17-beta-dehydrogenase, putative [Entamoeba invadens IP1]ELP90103.1 estradiol 17-beta-dehydrogenase, putative [Entamoeba invadens IP1]|eukprot:XP_004256874.1 estradiol 17-beta-dehydrogenase, putative [Entamoeba invadens IP1]
MEGSQLVLALVGGIVSVVLVFPVFQMLYRLFIRPFLNPNPIKKYKNEGAYAFITGATSGVGKAFAERFANEGFNLIISARREQNLTELKNELESKYKTNVVVQVSDFSIDSKEQWETIHKLFETYKIRVLINNVGKSSRGTFAGETCDETQSLINLNLWTPVKLSHFFISTIPQHEQGLIIYMGGALGEFVTPFCTTYSSSKAFVNLFGQCLSYENENVACTVFSPWFISTEMTHHKQPNLSVLTPEHFVALAMKHVGLTNFCCPHWFHYLQGIGYYCFPDKVKAAINKKMIPKKDQ